MKTDRGKKMKIRSICWERIYLHIEFDEPVPDGCELFLTNGAKRYVLECNGTHLCINITSVTGEKGEELLYNGEWRFQCTDKVSAAVPVTMSEETAGTLDDLDKVFAYCEGRYTYLVTFEAEENDDGLGCIIWTSYMRENRKPHKEYLWLEADYHPARACKKAISSVMLAFFRLLYRGLCLVRKKDGKHILLMSQTKTAIAANLDTINRRLQERGFDKSFKLSYSFKEALHMSEISAGIYWLKLVILLSKQDFVLIDDYAPVFKALPLDKNTKLIQVWHAGLGFKSVGYSRFGKKGSPRPLDSCHRNYDYVVVGSENLIPVYQEVFGLDKKKFLPFGVPRVDDFLNAEKAERYQADFYGRYPHLKGKKIILFAPTYRGAGQKEASYPYEKLDLKQIYEFCGESYIFAFKMHPFIKKVPEIESDFRSRIFDFSNEEINSLLHICDILITDYSSVIYEFVLLDRPILFYAFDKDTYRVTRGFHWDFERYAPGTICESFEELMNALKSRNDSPERRVVFREFGYDFEDAHATDRLIDYLFLEKKLP